MKYDINKISVRWIPDPYQGDGANVPVVLFDGKLNLRKLDLRCDVGMRAKLYLRNHIIKIDDFNSEIQQGRWEYKIWRKIKNHPDARYFVPILRFNDYHGFFVVPRLKLTTDGINDTHMRIIDRLKHKYNLSDVSTSVIRNWALNKQTGEPVIYDYGI